MKSKEYQVREFNPLRKQKHYILAVNKYYGTYRIQPRIIRNRISILIRTLFSFREIQAHRS
jgi:hypothetical protein